MQNKPVPCRAFRFRKPGATRFVLAWMVAVHVCGNPLLADEHTSAKDAGDLVLYRRKGVAHTWREMTGVPYEKALECARKWDHIGGEETRNAWNRRVSFLPWPPRIIPAGEPVYESILRQAGQGMVNLGLVEHIFDKFLAESGVDIEDCLNLEALEKNMHQYTERVRDGENMERVSHRLENVANFVACAMPRWDDVSAQPAKWMQQFYQAYKLRALILYVATMTEKEYARRVELERSLVTVATIVIDDRKELDEFLRILDLTVAAEQGEILMSGLKDAIKTAGILGHDKKIRIAVDQSPNSLASLYNTPFADVPLGKPVRIDSADGVQEFAVVLRRKSIDDQEALTIQGSSKMRDMALMEVLNKYLSQAGDDFEVFPPFEMPSIDEIGVFLRQRPPTRRGKQLLEPVEFP